MGLYLPATGCSYFDVKTNATLASESCFRVSGWAGCAPVLYCTPGPARCAISHPQSVPSKCGPARSGGAGLLGHPMASRWPRLN